MLARMAGERSPSKEPEIVSLLPANAAFNEPDPVTVGNIVASTGIVERRALNESACWARAEHAASKIKVATNELTHLRCLAIMQGCEIILASTPARHLTPTVSRL